MKRLYSVTIIAVLIMILSGCDGYDSIEYEKESYLEDNALNYVKRNYEINDVFDDYDIWQYMIDYHEEELKEYVADNYSPEEVYSDLTDYINGCYDPEEIYPDLEYDPETR